MNTLLLELLTEELPPKALAKLGDAFAQGIFNGLQQRGLLARGAQATPFATPRRLAVQISEVLPVAPDQAMREKVLPVSVALDAHGKPTAPLAKKLAALGFADLPLSALERAQDGKAESLFYSYTAPGTNLRDGLQAALSETISKLPIPKVMLYQLHAGTPQAQDVHFVRPAQRLVALYGSEVVPVSVLGLHADRLTQGHRFLAHATAREATFTIPDATHYAELLQNQGKVIASFRQRKEAIRTALLAAAGKDQVLMPEALLDEVNALVEWPVVYACHFEEAFLAVPQECLILTMQTNQKYFALTDANGKLRNRFLIVSNLATATPASIIEGNERVVRPRLADAKFFFEQDKKKSLAERLPQLASVVYHNKLGTQLERVARVQTLAQAIGETIGGTTLAQAAHTAAQLAKTDLATDMVGEFPELQGIMGRYYALHDGLSSDIAEAIEDHYKPRFAGDAIPRSKVGLAVALADKMETLAGLFGIGQVPTGDKDPFALRRHALGVVRMLIEPSLQLSLSQLVDDAFHALGDKVKPAHAELLAFMYDRLAGYCRELGYSTQEVDAVLAQRPDLLCTVPAQLAAVQSFAQLPEAATLAAANKRISNLLKKSAAATGTVQTRLLQEPAEQALHAALSQVAPLADKLFQNGEFTASLRELAVLKAPVDAFFEAVMVNAEDPALRANRLALLAQLHGAMNRVADLSRLASAA